MKTYFILLSLFRNKYSISSILLVKLVIFLSVPFSIAQTPVEWTDLVNVSADGNTLTKTSVSPSLEGGASSLQIIFEDGAISVHVDQTNTTRMFGFSASNLDAGYQTIDYAFLLSGNGGIYVYESGDLKNNVPLGNYAIGDQLSVERTGDVIEYKQNGLVVYTSDVSFSGPLLVDTFLYENNARIHNAMITGARSTWGPLFLDVEGGNLGPADAVDYRLSPFWLRHDDLNFAFDGDQISSDAPSFIIQNTNPDGNIVFHTGASTVDRMIIDSDGNVTIPGSLSAPGIISASGIALQDGTTISGSTDLGNPDQMLSVNGFELTISGGNTVNLPSAGVVSKLVHPSTGKDVLFIDTNGNVMLLVPGGDINMGDFGGNEN